MLGGNHFSRENFDFLQSFLSVSIVALCGSYSPKLLGCVMSRLILFVL